MPLSVRWRLTLWNVLALAVVLAVFSVLVYGLLAHALYEQVDRSLRAELAQLGRQRAVHLLEEGVGEQAVDQQAEAGQHHGQCQHVPQRQAPADAQGHGGTRRL